MIKHGMERRGARKNQPRNAMVSWDWYWLYRAALFLTLQSQRTWKEEDQQNYYLGLAEAKLWAVWETGSQSPLGDITEGQRNPGFLQVRNLKSLFLLLTGTSHPCTLGDELVGKSTSLAEQRALLELREKMRRVFPSPLEEGSTGGLHGYSELSGRKSEGPKPS